MNKDELFKNIIVMVIASSIVFTLVLVFPTGGNSTSSKEEKTSTYLVGLNKKTLASAESAIAKAKQESIQSSINPNDLRARFSNSVILGDSLAEGIKLYNILPASNCVGVKGQSIKRMQGDFDSIKANNPKNVFMEYGLNDLGILNGSSDLFYKYYKQQIEYIRSQLPNAKIFITIIIPVRADKANKGEHVYINSFNEKIRQLAKDLKVTLFDPTSLLSSLQTPYSPDGIHPVKTYYEMWVKKMISEAGM